MQVIPLACIMPAFLASGLWLQYVTRITEPFLTFTKEYRGWLCTKMHAAGQQIVHLPCAGVYEADKYCGCMVYIRANSQRHIRCRPTLCSPFAVTRTLTQCSVACYPLLYFPDCTYQGHKVTKVAAQSKLEVLLVRHFAICVCFS